MLLEDARYHLASGFMMVYPTVFLHHDVLNLYATGKTVNWRVFTGNLNMFFRKLHDSKNQTPSCFIGDDPASVVNESVTGQMDVAAVKSRFDFFIPAFIWNFNNCKRNLSQLDEEISQRSSRISEVEDSICQWRKQIDGSPPPQMQPPQVQPPKSKGRFLLGTALSLRQRQRPLPLGSGTALRGKGRKGDKGLTKVTTPWLHPETAWFFSNSTNYQAQVHPDPPRIRGDKISPSPTAALGSRVRGRGGRRVQSPVRGRAAASIHTGIGSSSRALAGATPALPDKSGKYIYFYL